MANTWLNVNAAVNFSGTVTMAGLMNGGSRVLRVRRIGMHNSQTAAVTGVFCRIRLTRLRATASWSGRTSATPIPMDTTNSALDTVSAGSAGTLSTTGTTDILYKCTWSTDEPQSGATTSPMASSADEFECNIPMNIIWDQGYKDSSTQQPLALRTDEAVAIVNINAAASGALDSWMEFTDEAS